MTAVVYARCIQSAIIAVLFAVFDGIMPYSPTPKLQEEEACSNLYHRTEESSPPPQAMLNVKTNKERKIRTVVK